MATPEPHILTIIGVIFTIIGLAITSWAGIINWSKTKTDIAVIKESNKSLKIQASNLESINSSQSNQLQELSNTNADLIIANNVQLKELSELRNANILLSKELVSSTKELTNQITGGNEYAILKFERKDESNRITVSAKVEESSKYNMFDLKIRCYKSSLSDSKCQELFYKEPILQFDKSKAVFADNYGELPKGTNYIVSNFTPDSLGIHNYTVAIFARNGQYLNNLRIDLTENSFSYEMAIFERGKKVLYRKVSNDNKK